MLGRRSAGALLASITAGAFLSMARGQPPQEHRGHEPLVFTFPVGVDTSGLHLRYFMTGAFGGYGGFALGKSGTREYPVETVHEGQPALTFKAVVYLPGHQFEALDLSARLSDVDRRVEVVPRASSTIPLFGNITPRPVGSMARHAVTARYYPWWECEFFGLPDCALGGIEVARAAIEPSGRFAMDLPDYANDSAVARFANPGEFALDIRDTATRNPLFTLRREGGETGMGRLAVSRGYPGELVFSLRTVH